MMTGIVRSRMPAVSLRDDVDLYSCIAENVAHKLDSPAFVDVSTSQTMTFRDVLDTADVIARHLTSRGFKRGDTIVLFGRNCLEYPVLALTALRLGGTFAGVNHLLTAGDLERLLELCDGKFIFTTKDVLSKAIQGSKNSKVKMIICLEETGRDDVISYSQLTKVTPDLPSIPDIRSLGIRPGKEPCCILFSSGTTGLPKAVMLSHSAFVSVIQIQRAPATRILRERNLIFVPMSHLAGIGLSMFGMGAASCGYVMKEFDPIVYVETIAKYKLEVIHVVPPIAVLLAKSPMVEKYDLSSVEVVACGAAPLSAEIEKKMCLKLKGPKCRVVQMYGMTETGGGVTIGYMDPTLIPPGAALNPPGCCGALLPNWEAKVVDVSSGAILGPGQDGELLFRGPGTMLGYQKNPEATSNTLDKDGWLHSGDIGHYDSDGYFYIVDRLKELIKYKGYQVSPSEMDAVVLSHPAVAECGVIGLPDPEAGELPHAWVVKKQGVTVTEQEIMDYVKEKVAPYKRLRGGIRFVEAIPKTASGKILRRGIKELMNKPTM